MPKEWSSFRITLLLYILVLILPLSFYFVYSSFKTIQTDTKVVHQTAGMGGTVEYLALNSQNRQETMTHIDQTLQDISAWVTQNNDSHLYIGTESLSQDFEKVNGCWNTYKKDHPKLDALTINASSLQCWEYTDHLATNVEKMVYLKQNKMINYFYIALTIAMILTLLIIYTVRTYIRIQMKKHAIHDHETNLFNKKYFLSELKTSCARSTRHNYPLSMLSIFINNFETANYDNKTKEHILKVLGGMVISLTRTSDVACRYDENHIAILLTDTEEENALFLEGRIREALEKHDFDVSPQLNFKFSTIYFNTEETAETFVSRTQDLLK